jgi:hypothetical protein
MAARTTHGVRIDNMEKRMDKHDQVLEKMGDAQTDMMVSLAKLHGSVKILIVVMAAGLGVDLGGVIF